MAIIEALDEVDKVLQDVDAFEYVEGRSIEEGREEERQAFRDFVAKGFK
jgi:flavin-binding protein dodecin